MRIPAGILGVPDKLHVCVSLPPHQGPHQPLQLAAPSGAAHSVKAAQHLPHICGPFKEICNPALRSVWPHQLDGNCPLDHVLLG